MAQHIPHLGYYLPDATEVRFDYEEGDELEQEISLGESFQLRFHYNNCSSVTFSKLKRPDGKSLSTLPECITLEIEAVLKNICLSGTPDMVGTWQIALKANNPSNGTGYSIIAKITVNDATGINDVEVEEKPLEESEVYDLQGRIHSGKLIPGIYIINGKKYVIK